MRTSGLLGGGLVVALIVALAGIGLVDVLTINELPNHERDRVFADFSSPRLDVTNDGTPLTVLDTGRNASELAVVGSELTHGRPEQSNAAGYLEARMTAPVSRIGAVAEFHSAKSGAIGLVSSSDSIADDSGTGVRAQLPSSGILFAATNRRWHFSVWDSAAQRQQVLLHGTLALPDDGTGHAFEVVRYGDVVTIRLPDGTMHATTDSRIAQWTGPWAYWQLYELDAEEVPATLTAVWGS
ncbi:hypothetical protein [Mycobacterium sp. IDR2000157661]|uniref:hypothetical protein n=1 Tax=Mycobacterium sp. IDR2000157661 TaxID=2867005 RepID=UPI001EE9DC67|nr:hypothetical protein [Mycobacterium sp. IDR2000157661]ULE33635.1 hypothetical protein K3G64_02695 [Mycobacterium sp. IDR2000157661]